MRIEKGQVIALTEGAYSDYHLRDHVRALSSFDTDEAIAVFMESPEYLKPWDNDPDGELVAYGSDDRFIAWAIRRGLIEPLPVGEVVEWYIGEYGEVQKEERW